MAEFKYKIGDTVIQRIGLVEAVASARCGQVAVPKHFMVVGRLRDECSGGEQLHYVLSYGREKFQVAEIEVGDPGEFDSGALLTELVRHPKATP